MIFLVLSNYFHISGGLRNIIILLLLLDWPYLLLSIYEAIQSFTDNIMHHISRSHPRFQNTLMAFYRYHLLCLLNSSLYMGVLAAITFHTWRNWVSRWGSWSKSHSSLQWERLQIHSTVLKPTAIFIHFSSPFHSFSFLSAYDSLLGYCRGVWRAVVNLNLFPFI